MAEPHFPSGEEGPGKTRMPIASPRLAAGAVSLTALRIAAGMALAFLFACSRGGDSEPDETPCCGARSASAELPTNVTSRSAIASGVASSKEVPNDYSGELEALGYIEVTEDPVDPGHSGVVLLDRTRAQPGYSLYCNHNEGFAELIDLEGRALRQWMSPNTRHWASCKLLPNGDLLVVGTDLDPAAPRKKLNEQRYLMVLSWDGSLRWKRYMTAHHHAALTPDGDILTLDLRYRVIPEVHTSVVTRDDFLVLLSREGEERMRRSLWEAFRSRPDLLTVQPVEVLHRWGREHVDLIHANTAEFIHHPELADRHPIYAAGNVLVTSRLQNAIAVVDWQTNRLVWAWGPGQVMGPHDATILENGNILLLDNGNKERGWSRVIELDPIEEKIVWSYQSPDPSDFFTVARGACQRLPNGNTLITDSNNGRAFEVTRAGEIVWDFLNPHLSSDNRRPGMRRVERYPPDYVDPLLTRSGSPTTP